MADSQAQECACSYMDISGTLGRYITLIVCKIGIAEAL